MFSYSICPAFCITDCLGSHAINTRYAASFHFSQKRSILMHSQDGYDADAFGWCFGDKVHKRILRLASWPFLRIDVTSLRHARANAKKGFTA